MRPLLFLILSTISAACSRSSSPRAAADAAPILSSAPAPAFTTATAGAGDEDDIPSPPPFVNVAPRPPGPIAVKGYPHAIRSGMNDPASHVGFTREGSKEGSLFGYCAPLGGRDPQETRCELVDRNGDPMELTSDTKGQFDPRKKAEIDELLRDNGIPEIKAVDPMSAKPAPIDGTWTFTDITLDVLRVAPTLDESGVPVAQALVKVGGSVGAEAPVYPVAITMDPGSGAPPHFAVMNGMAISPDGREIGMVAHFHACEWCDSFEIKRMPLATLASRIYNDTGFRLHDKGHYDRAAVLFAKAVAADPTATLAPYNLACAWARLGDPRAKDALAYAIARDASAQARARSDQDFANVRGESWFVEATR